MPTLLEVVFYLGDIPASDPYPRGPTIYARQPWNISSDALVLSGNDCPDGVTTMSGHDYLLEVELARDAVEVWSEWRGGATPTPERRRWPLSTTASTTPTSHRSRRLTARRCGQPARVWRRSWPSVVLSQEPSPSGSKSYWCADGGARPSAPGASGSGQVEVHTQTGA